MQEIQALIEAIESKAGQIADAEGPSELFHILLDGGALVSPRAGLYLHRKGVLKGWGTRGYNREEAERLSQELKRLDRPHLYGENLYRAAGIEALLGNRDRAMDLLRESLARGHPFGLSWHRDIDLEPLWDHPPFQDLLRPKG